MLNKLIEKNKIIIYFYFTISGFFFLSYNISGKDSFDLKKGQDNYKHYDFYKSCNKKLRFFKNKLYPLVEEIGPENIHNDFIQLKSIIKMNICKNMEDKRSINNLLALYNKHTKTIGIILPLSGKNSKLGSEVLSGIKKYCQKKKINFDKMFKVYDTSSESKKVDKVIAQLILKDKISMIIGGVQKKSAQEIKIAADNFFIPSLILNQDSKLFSDKSYSFQVFPNIGRFAETIVTESKERSYNSLAILRSTKIGFNERVEKITQEGEKQGLQIEIYDYEPNNFNSMNAAVENLANLNSKERKKEKTQSFFMNNKMSEEDKVSFDTNSIVLEPELKVDAIFIPDNFRIIHHFIKLFKYNGINHIPLIGDEKWRSKSLINPWTRFLKGSFFIDFIGFYNHLPSNLLDKKKVDPYFISSHEAYKIDYRSMGYVASSIAIQNIGKEKYRYKLKSILKTNPIDSELIKYPIPFQQNHQSLWPTFVFDVKEKNLMLK
ncbi:MAG: hypothetical protein CMP11_09540 [Zetaproteobacteria bacterium]|nr:hypothetical protein [Pseudobdellovibrionaceae bacterium]|tara:strand:+ start:115 stop:1587 length:1473 start_codon:yes stop_codon:yes gene_type:complete